MFSPSLLSLTTIVPRLDLFRPPSLCLSNDPAISLLCSHSLASENCSISPQFDANFKVIWKSFHFSIIANFYKLYKSSDLAVFESTLWFKTFGEAGCGRVCVHAVLHLIGCMFFVIAQKSVFFCCVCVCGGGAVLAFEPQLTCLTLSPVLHKTRWTPTPPYRKHTLTHTHRHTDA